MLEFGNQYSTHCWYLCCDLFSDDDRSWDYVAWDDKIINKYRVGKNMEEHVCGNHLSGGIEKFTKNAVQILGVLSANPTIYPQLQDFSVITWDSFLGLDVSAPIYSTDVMTFWFVWEMELILWSSERFQISVIPYFRTVIVGPVQDF
jgi:hypothetical protein